MCVCVCVSVGGYVRVSVGDRVVLYIPSSAELFLSLLGTVINATVINATSLTDLTKYPKIKYSATWE